MSGKFKQISNTQLKAKIKELEDAGKYKRELEKRGIK